MEIKVKGELPIAEIRQALFEKLHEIEDDLAVRYSMGATSISIHQMDLVKKSNRTTHMAEK